MNDLTSKYAAERSPLTNGAGSFDGETFDPAKDAVRLTGQLQDVFNLMCDGKWRSLAVIEEEMCCVISTPSISARLRDFRKPRFGGHVVNRRSFSPGVFEYQLLVQRRTT